jgi:uncharacterized protein YoxC
MTPTVPDPSQPPEAAQPRKRHPWQWIVPCVLLLIVAIGLAIWAFSLQSDLDDERAHSAQVEQEAQATQDDVQAVSDQVAELSQSLSSAAEDLSTSTDQAAQNAQAALTDVQNSIQSLSDRAKSAKDKLSQAINEAKAAQD